jgi:hypothetical protein
MNALEPGQRRARFSNSCASHAKLDLFTVQANAEDFKKMYHPQDSAGGAMTSDEWVTEKSRENMIHFYSAELRRIYFTHTAQHLHPSELQRFREEGWIEFRRHGRYPYTYDLTKEAIRVLKLED